MGKNLSGRRLLILSIQKIFFIVFKTVRMPTITFPPCDPSRNFYTFNLLFGIVSKVLSPTAK